MKKELEKLNQAIAKAVDAFQKENQVEVFTIHVDHRDRGTKKYSFSVFCSITSQRTFKNLT